MKTPAQKYIELTIKERKLIKQVRGRCIVLNVRGKDGQIQQIGVTSQEFNQLEAIAKKLTMPVSQVLRIDE